MAIGDRKIYRSRKPKISGHRKVVVAVKSQTGEIIITEFTSHVEAKTYADHAKRLGCEVLIGWGE